MLKFVTEYDFDRRILEAKGAQWCIEELMSCLEHHRDKAISNVNGLTGREFMEIKNHPRLSEWRRVVFKSEYRLGGGGKDGDL